jgi:hypothetical protein
LPFNLFMTKRVGGDDSEVLAREALGHVDRHYYAAAITALPDDEPDVAG